MQEDPDRAARRIDAAARGRARHAGRRRRRGLAGGGYRTGGSAGRGHDLPQMAPVPEAANVTGTAQALTLERQPLQLGPLEKVYVYWMAGMSCDGCSISVLGATQPPIEALLTGAVPGLPRLILHHPVLAVDAGEAFVKHFEGFRWGLLR